jgi:hypothetical protein
MVRMERVGWKAMDQDYRDAVIYIDVLLNETMRPRTSPRHMLGVRRLTIPAGSPRRVQKAKRAAE